MSYDTYEAARLLSWSNKQAGIPPLTEAELTEWIDAGVGGLDWEDVWEEDGKVEKYIDFSTLISLRLICFLRSCEVPLKVLTEATPRLRVGLSVKWPYASKSLWNYPVSPLSSATDAVIPVDRGLAILAKSNALDPSGLEFGADGLACAWLPVKDIKIDPRFVSGSPCLAGTRIPTWIFPGMVKGGDSIEEIADDYGIAKERVENALEWERQLANVGI